MTTHDLREKFMDTLSTIASAEKLLEYDKITPIENVLDELINRWFDNLYNPNTTLFESAFNAQERRELDRFNFFFDKYVNSMPDNQKVIDLQTSNEWKEIQLLASQTINKCAQEK